jgi:hypothetical protein
MRAVYRVLAWVLAAEVFIQAAAVTVAVFGLAKWIQGGGVLDKAVMENQSGGFAFPEEAGFMVHALNGQMVVPVLALLLLVVSFFARDVRRGVAAAAAVFGLVVLQVLLGLFAHDLPALGLLHGVNALLLFVAIGVAARRASGPAPAAAGTVAPAAGRHSAATTP